MLKLTPTLLAIGITLSVAATTGFIGVETEIDIFGKMDNPLRVAPLKPTGYRDQSDGHRLGGWQSHPALPSTTTA